MNHSTSPLPVCALVCVKLSAVMLRACFRSGAKKRKVGPAGTVVFFSRLVELLGYKHLEDWVKLKLTAEGRGRVWRVPAMGASQRWVLESTLRK